MKLLFQHFSHIPKLWWVVKYQILSLHSPEQLAKTHQFCFNIWEGLISSRAQTRQWHDYSDAKNHLYVLRNASLRIWEWAWYVVLWKDLGFWIKKNQTTMDKHILSQTPSTNTWLPYIRTWYVLNTNFDYCTYKWVWIPRCISK